jgi:hypothetical protein
MKQIDKLRQRYMDIEAARDEASFDVKTSAFTNGYRELSSDLLAACHERDGEIARLRKRLAEWVERLRWADGLTDVVEQMREEAEV